MNHLKRGSEVHDLCGENFVAEHMSVEISAKCTPLGILLIVV